MFLVVQASIIHYTGNSFLGEGAVFTNCAFSDAYAKTGYGFGITLPADSFIYEAASLSCGKSHYIIAY